MAKCYRQWLSYPVPSNSLYFLIKGYMSLVETFGLLMDRAWLWNLPEKLFPSFWERNPPPVLWQSQQYFQWGVSHDMKQIDQELDCELQTEDICSRLTHCSRWVGRSWVGRVRHEEEECWRIIHPHSGCRLRMQQPGLDWNEFQGRADLRRYLWIDRSSEVIYKIGHALTY